jgi:hypothetical protein
MKNVIVEVETPPDTNPAVVRVNGVVVAKVTIEGNVEPLQEVARPEPGKAKTKRPGVGGVEDIDDLTDDEKKMLGDLEQKADEDEAATKGKHHK